VTSAVRLDPAAIAELYQAFVHRVPAASEIAHWQNAGISLGGLVEAFLASAEFRAGQAPASATWVPPGHFYSPIVDVASSPRLASTPPAAIALSREQHLARWHGFLPTLAAMPFPEQRGEHDRYWYRNPAFGHADAMTYNAMLAEHRPRRVIEIGSGYSSALLLDVAERALPATAITFVEPYPELLLSLMRPGDRERVTIVDRPVQDVGPELFDQLEANDVLFIDSTHVAKTGSDVLYEMFEIVPRLRAGVLIHVHDIFWPFEYPVTWVMDENRSWNEAYLLRALLMYNDAFEIVFWNDYFARTCMAEIARTHPPFLQNTGGSIWLRKRRSA
jgi:hypothetical protein